MNVEEVLNEQKQQMIERTGPRNQQRTRMSGKEDKVTTAGVVHEVQQRQKLPKTTLFSSENNGNSRDVHLK